MRSLILTALLLAALPAQADWRTQDTQRQAVYLTLHAIDWRQTRTIAKDDEWVEYNPVIGEDPSTGEVDAYFAAMAALHTLVAHQLSPHYRERWQYVTIGLQAGTVAHNARIGIRIDW